MAEEAKKIADDKGLAISVLSGKDLAPFGGLRAVGILHQNQVHDLLS